MHRKNFFYLEYIKELSRKNINLTLGLKYLDRVLQITQTELIKPSSEKEDIFLYILIGYQRLLKINPRLRRLVRTITNTHYSP